MSADPLTQTFGSPLFSVQREAGVLVIMARSTQPLGAGRSLEQALNAMRSEVQKAHNGKPAGLLLDFRRAPVRIDEEFEQAFARARPLVCLGFRRVAFLMSSTLGKLQAQRYARDDGQGAQAFLNEKLALTFVRPQSASHRA
jgi:hypothetical protein